MASPQSNWPRVTIVEDDASLLNALTFALETNHYIVTPYRTAQRALTDMCDCDCLVADLKLPDIDGLTLIERLRDLGVRPPAILITTNPSERCRQRAASAHVTIVEKPLLSGELGRHIADAIAGRADA